MDEVKRVRQEIDHIDTEIVRLLKERYEYAKRMGRIKKTRGLALRDPEREGQILRRVQRMASEMGLPQTPVRRIFLQIFNTAVVAQESRPLDGRELAGLKLLVAGGTGGMGMLFANLAASHGASVRIFGRIASRSRSLANELGLESGDFTDAGNSDLVLVAVPTEATLKVSLKLGSMMKPGGLLTDLSSVKSGVADKIAQGTRDIEYVSLHPLFGPDVSHIGGQHIMAISFRVGPKWKNLFTLLEKEGAHVHLTTVRQHDRTMARIQGIHHFALICLGLSLAGWSGEYSTRSLQITERQVKRMLESWHTVIGIQRLNPFSAQGRRGFSHTVDSMVRMGPAESKFALRVLTGNVQKWSRKQ